MAKRVNPQKIGLKERQTTFQETTKGLLPHQALAEAGRCLFCHDAPCIKSCPAGVDIANFIRKIKTKNFSGSARLIREANFLAAVCGRICPTEKQCEKGCSQSELSEPINIGALQRYVSDIEIKKINYPRPGEKKSRKIAVVGGGPAGLAAALELTLAGYPVVVYERTDKLGGMMVWAIPDYRLPKDIVEAEIEPLKRLGIEFRYGQELGGNLNLGQLVESYDAVILACGLIEGTKLNISGGDLTGVYSALDFLNKINRRDLSGINLGNRCAVIGAGSTAMDAASCARKLGTEKVLVVYRRSETEMPAARDEYEEAREIGVEFHWLTNPKRILGDGKVEKLECVKCELKEPDASGRPRPVEICGSEFILDVDSVILALGQKAPDNLIAEVSKVIKVEKNLPVLDKETLRSSHPRIWVAGDFANGGKTVAQAVGEGRRAAKNIIASFNE